MLSPTTTIHRCIMFWTLSLLLYCIGVALFAQQNYQNSKQQLLQGVDRQLTAAAHALPAKIDDSYQDLALRHDPTLAESKLANGQKLASYVEKSALDHLYSLIVINNQFLITASSSAQNARESEALSTRLNHAGRDALAAIYEANRTGRVQFFEFADTNGYFRSTFVPQRTANGTRYIVAADVDITPINTTLRAEVYRSILAALMLLLFTAPILYTGIRQYAQQCKSARQELHKRLQELALSKRINNQYLMTFRVNALGQVMEISDAYTKTTGIDAQHLIGHHFKDIFGDYIDYENLRAIQAAITDAKPLEFCDEHPLQNNGSFYAKICVLPWAPELSDRRNSDKQTTLRELMPDYESGAVFIIEDLSHLKRLEASRVRDEQTRLYNRRYFNELVPNEINRARRENRQLLMLLLEVDPQCFIVEPTKSEQLVPVLAHKLQRLCQRSSDFVFRLNEYEFAILCTTDSPSAASRFADKVQQQVEAAMQVLDDDLRQPPQFYFSIGMAINAPLTPLSLGEFYRRAHQSLQQQSSEPFQAAEIISQ